MIIRMRFQRQMLSCQACEHGLMPLDLL
jgi:hypothetical protein